MAASALMSIGIKSLEASYAALQVTGHNIANANVKGFSRQKLELATAEGQFSGAGFFGKGVDVVAIKRVYSEYLAREANITSSAAKLDSTRLSLLKQLEKVLPPGENGAGHAAGQFLNAFVDLASRPADSATREVVMARAQEMALRFSNAGNQIESIQRNLVSDARAQIAEINQLAANIAQANQRIGEVAGFGHSPNDMLDERDRLIARLNDIVQVNTITGADGALSVSMGGGYMLVLGEKSSPLTATANDEDPSRLSVGYTDGTEAKNLDESLLTGGSLVGLLRFQNEDLRDSRALMGRLVTAVTGAVNEQQRRGVNLYHPFNSAPSENFFEVGGPRAIPNARNLRDPGTGDFVGSVSVTITDTRQLKASEYRLKADPAGVAGAWELTRLYDGHKTTVYSGDVVDGFRIDISNPPPAGGDTFILQPVSHASAGTRMLLDDVRDIAAASPLVATAVPTPSGTVSIDWLRMHSPAPYVDHTIRMEFTDDQGNYTWTLTDAAGNAVSSGTGLWQPGGTIPAEGAPDMNGFTMKLMGVPRLGDVIEVAPSSSQNFQQNNGNALALAALRDDLIVDGLKASDSYAAAMADVGVRVSGAQSTAKLTESLANAAAMMRDSESGVNMDEEAARLIQYQQAYQAAAKVLRTAQNIIDALLEASGG